MNPVNERATRPRRLWRWAIAAVCVLLLCVGALLGPRLANAFSLMRDGQQISIGDREIFIHCKGSGSPTVLLEHGLGSNGLEWQTVQGDLAEEARVCWSSRAGMGFSDPAPGTAPRSAQDAVDDLNAALAGGGLDGPFVLVGHSFGGFVVRLFADQHPGEVVGVVLVDSVHADQTDLLRHRLSPTAWGELAPVFGTDNPEKIDLMVSAGQVQQSGDLGSLPLIVLQASDQSSDAEAAGVSWATADELDAAMADLWPDLQADLAALSTRGSHRVVTGSGHFIQIDDPDAVAAAIREILAEVEATRGTGGG